MAIQPGDEKRSANNAHPVVYDGEVFRSRRAARWKVLCRRAGDTPLLIPTLSLYYSPQNPCFIRPLGLLRLPCESFLN
jgi:hypothetical protein